VAKPPNVLRTVSPRSGYGGEAMLVRVASGKVVSVEGDPKDRHTRGRLSPTTARAAERALSRERLLRPLARKGDRGSGEFEEIEWDDAIDRIAAALSQVAREHDPRALLYLTGNGHDGVMAQFGNLFLSYYGGYSSVYGDLCNSAGMEAVRLTFGSLLHHPPEDYAKSRLVILWGRNPAVTNPAQMAFLEEARASGTRLCAIDPLRTKSARLCDEHIALRPGTDGFFANSVAHVLVEEELYDKAFVERAVHGFEDYRWMVRNYEPKKAEPICGIPAARVVAFARALAAAKPVNISAGFGLQRYRNGGQTVRAVAALQALTGNIGVEGGGFDYFNQAAFVTRPYPFRVPAPPRIRQIGATSRLGRAILNAADPPVQAAIIERANPITQTPFTSATHYGLARLDFVCVIDQFLTDTALRADVVLPAKSMFEETDVVSGPWTGVLSLKPGLVDPPGEVRTERGIYRALAERLGYPTEQFDIDGEEMLNRVLPPGLSVNRLRKQAFDRRGPSFTPFADGRFGTPSGKIEIRCEAAEVSWQVDPLPFYAPPRESEQSDPERFKKYPLTLLTPKSEHRFCSQGALDPVLGRAEGAATVALHPDDAKGRGIGEGKRVRVFNDRGEIKLPARLDDGVRPGVAVIPQGRWISRDGFSVNVLTHDDVSDMGYGAIPFDCLVEVEAVPEK